MDQDTGTPRPTIWHRVWHALPVELTVTIIIMMAVGAGGLLYDHFRQDGVVIVRDPEGIPFTRAELFCETHGETLAPPSIRGVFHYDRDHAGDSAAVLLVGDTIRELARVRLSYPSQRIVVDVAQ